MEVRAAPTLKRRTSMNADSKAHSKPAVFAGMAFADAQVAARESQRLLVIDATASWCAPCQHMDHMTWVDPQVVDWVQAHAVAIQLDVDEDNELAEQLHIRSMPTIVIFKDG